MPIVKLLFILFLLPAAAYAVDCQPTQQQTTGTHYKPVINEKTDISSGLIVRGRILEAHTCRPISHARVAHWQADKTGEYVDHLRAYLLSNEKGEYQFETEWPALSVPHIHFIVSAEGYETIETQWTGDAQVNVVQFDIILRNKLLP
jgi:protocatechuate 3,4-dioxygenase beta subunit